MSGLGNDFVIVDAINTELEPDIELVIKMSDRHLGIGCDQVLWLSRASTGVLYRIFNPDGSEAYMCGNGARCVGYYMHMAHDFNLWPLDLIMGDGNSITVSMVSDNIYSVNMGQAYPVSENIYDEHYFDGLKFTAVDVGNPHAIFFTDEDLDLSEISRGLTGHKLFPKGVNVSMASLIDSKNLRARVFERGVGETLACGSAACAIYVAGLPMGLDQSGGVSIAMPGGDILVSGKIDSLTQQGQVSLSFVGRWQKNPVEKDIFYFARS